MRGYELPIAATFTTASDHDVTQLRPVLEKARGLHPWLRPASVTVDAGYDAGHANEFVVNEMNAVAVIKIRKLRRGHTDDIADEDGTPLCLGGQPMTFLGYSDGKLSYRCPTGGCQLKGRQGVLYCDTEVEIDPQENLRRFSLIPRRTKEWAKLYGTRQSVERCFSRLWSPRRPVSRGSQGRAPIGRGECEMPQLSFEDGFDLHFEQYGPPAGTAPAVVFAHGAGGNAFSWWQQVPAFADRYTVVTFDHRAFGRSTDVADGPGRIAFGTDLRSLLDHLGLERIHLVAHSMGGRTAFGIVSRQPERIASLTYSGTNGGCVDDRYRELRARLDQDGTLAGSLLQRALARGYAEREPHMQYLYGRIRSINPPRDRDFLKPTGRMINYRGSTAERLRDGGWPILWVVGEEDRVVPADLIRISHELTPESELAVIPEAGHSAYFERPDLWNGAVRSFIDRTEAGGAGSSRERYTA